MAVEINEVIVIDNDKNVNVGVITATTYYGENINLTGVVTAIGANFSGNVSVGGTLTYEDVTNIDSVGLITARSGINVLAGGIDVTGVTTASSFVGDGSQLTNIRTLEATASGTLADGSKVLVNADGTVSVVTQTVSGPGTGTPTVYNSNGNTVFSSAVYDSTNQKVVIAYRDDGNSNYGTAVVGTVSGTSISFGSPVVFENSQSIQNPKITFDSSNNKVVIIYSLANNFYGHGIVGTVSGTSISFGSSTAFTNFYFNVASAVFDSSNNKIVAIGKNESNSTGACYVGTVSGTSISFGSLVTFKNGNLYQISGTFDSSNNKVVIAYRDTTNSNYGTAIVGTVSGTSISFGSAAVFESAATTRVSATFDSTNNKVVIAYTDEANSNYGTAVVGTVSGTSISFGTPVVFHSAQTFYISLTYDSSNQKVIIAYQDSGNSNYGTAIIGTVSGTSITFGSSIVFNSGSTSWTSATYDSTNGKVVIAYANDGNSGYGTGVVFSSSSVSTNLTAENYIGISDGAYSNGQTATIQLIGSVDDAQSGLTTARSYYVQNDGTLGLTPDSPSVFAGTAVSDTQLIVKG